MSGYTLSDMFSAQRAISSQLHVCDKGIHPFVCPSRTSHTRLFPKKHGFSYSYLLVAVPVGWRGKVGSMISVDHEDSTWISVKASDHLSRGDGQFGIKEKLALYIKSQGENLDDYTSSWLVTAPRFLGYSFNPVSFWYLYKGSKLSAMILEVNNTFGERRMYFMKQGELEATTDGYPNEQRSAEANSQNIDSKFSHNWEKDFHVSPFNSRKGSYSLSAQDLLLSGQPKVDNTITLISSKHSAKIVARVFSTGAALDPANMTLLSKVHFLASWFWVGFLTFPRILKEAAKLFFQRKLHVWYRPEVLRGSIGRTESARESRIESCFRAYLEHVVESSALAVPLKYTTAGNEYSRQAVFHTPLSASLTEPPAPVELTILTPQFYIEFVLAEDPYLYLKSHHLNPVAEQTFYTSNIHILLSYFQHPAEVSRNDLSASHMHSWQLLATLRRSKEHVLDDFVKHEVSRDQADKYRGAAKGLLLAQYIAFGIPELLDLVLVLLRFRLCYTSFDALLARLQGQQLTSHGMIYWVFGFMHFWLVAEQWLLKRTSRYA
ncbi:MAG: hypothetical protein MMC23_001600 [Stictis urceolatum]|nr:hypothetical protein [Stictis urceolata]